jgi:predicted regulator of Ras-like GTPase activity (Roadblock/LC7/MglB family)
MFQETLKQLVDRVDGAVAGILMGYDGISVESYTRPTDPTDIQTVGMELAHVIAQMRKAAEMLEVGRLTEVSLKAEKLTVLVYALNEEYFLAFAIAADGNFGKARYVLRLVAPKIQAEL